MDEVWDVYAELDEAEDELASALDVLEDVVVQACKTTEGGTLISLGYNAYANALRYLAERGRVTLTLNDGRDVVGWLGGDQPTNKEERKHHEL